MGLDHLYKWILGGGSNRDGYRSREWRNDPGSNSARLGRKYSVHDRSPFSDHWSNSWDMQDVRRTEQTLDHFYWGNNPVNSNPGLQRWTDHNHVLLHVDFRLLRQSHN